MDQPEFEYLGPYHVERTLGRGGMGTVYKGVHARSGDAIAIKVIAVGVANSPRFRRRFDVEIKTLQRLKHPNIVQLVGFGEEQGLLFYTMEYVEGHSLHEHLRQHSSMPWEEVVQVGIETASALKHAHDFGIIHRDLKPANLMLGPDGHIKLTDFGIAKLFGSSDMTAAGSVIGTADYMPPEQAEGKAVTIRSDLYSLGGVLFALLTGKAPFGGKSVPEVLYSVRYNPVPNLAELAPNIPDELVELIHQLLEKDPNKRPPTALVVGNRLKSLQQGTQRLASRATDSGQPSQSDSNTEIDADKKIGTHLTSLDLSDVEDDELRLTGDDMGKLGLKPNQLAAETHVSDPDIGTHEQQTLLAPGEFPLPPSAPESAAASQASQRERQFSAEFPVSPSDEEPMESVLTSGGPSHYTPIEEKASRQHTTELEEAPTQPKIDWLQIGSIAGIIALMVGCVGFAWWMLQPESADELYAKIQLAADSGDDSAMLSTQPTIDEFLTRFEDDERSAEVKSLGEESELTRWTRVLKRRASKEGGAMELSAVEQSFLDCMDARNQDYRAAQDKMSAFLAIFGSLGNLPKNEQRYVELIRYASEAKRASTGTEVPEAARQLEKLIQSAEKSLSEEALNTYYRNLVYLYGDKNWATEQLKRIRLKLEPEL